VDGASRHGNREILIGDGAREGDHGDEIDQQLFRVAAAANGESGQHHRGEPHELESGENRDPGERELDRLQWNEPLHEMGEEAVEMKRVVHQNVLDDALETSLVLHERKKARPEDSQGQ
jgi:hypothetical protein